MFNLTYNKMNLITNINYPEILFLISGWEKMKKYSTL